MTLKVDQDISLALLSVEHADALFELTEANRTFLRKWAPWLDTTTSVEDTKKYIEITLAQQKKGHAAQFIILFNDKLCGTLGFNELEPMHRNGSIGYWLSQSYTGQGIMTKCVAKLLEIGFTEMNLHKIEIRCAEENTISRAIPERLGFTYEATLRECEWLYTKFVDHAIYSLLASEYKAART